MFQKIKKFLIYTIIILTGIIALVLISLQIPSFQTYLINKTTNYVSENYGVKSKISNISIAFPNFVEFNDFIVFDHRDETLAEIEALKIDINKPFDLAKIVDIKNVSINNARFKIETYPKDTLSNLDYLLQKFESSDTSSTSLEIHLDELQISNFEFTMKDSASSTTLHTNHLTINDFILNDSLTSLQISGSDLELVDVVKTHSIHGQFNIRNGSIMELKDFSLAAGNSYIETYAKIEFPNNTMDWLDNKTIYDLDIKNLVFDKNDIQIEDLKKYVPKVVELEGKISGTPKKINVDKFLLKTNQSIANLSGRIKYPFNPKKINLKLNFNTLDIDKEIASFYLKDLSISENIIPLFPLHYKGLYKGNFIYNESKGSFKTAIGSINTDIQILLEDRAKNALYFANLDINKFQLNTLLNNSDFGETTMKINVDGEGFDFEKLKVKLETKIEKFVFKDYHYVDINANGNIEKDRYSGHLAVKDTNINVNFDGLVDLRPNSKNLDFKAHIKHLDLQALNFSDSIQTISANIDAALNDIDIDKADGQIKISDFKIENENGSFSLDSIKVITSRLDSQKRNLLIESEVFDLNASGDFKILELSNLVQQQLLPYIDYGQEKKYFPNQKINLTANLKNTDNVTRLFVPELRISKNTVLSIHKSYQEIPKVQFNSPYIVYNDKAFKNILLNVEEKDSVLNTNIGIEEIDLRTASFTVENVNLNNKILDNTIHSELGWKADFDSTNYSGKLDIKTLLDTNFNFVSTIDSTSHLFMADSLWGIKNTNKLSLIDGKFTIKDLEINANSQSLIINSELGSDSSSYAQVDFKEFKLTNLNPYLIKNDTKIGGEINGAISAKNLSTNLEIESVITLDSTIVNDIFLGDIIAYSYHDEDQNEAGFDINITRNGSKPIVAKLKYEIDKGLSSFNLVADVNKLRIDYADPYINEWVKNIKGRISGHITMTPDTLISNFSFEKVNFNIPSIGTRYNIEGKPNFFVNNDRFEIPEFRLNVLKKSKASTNFGQAILSGTLYHKNFVDYIYDLNIKFNDFLCLSTTEESENIFYGDAVISGELEMTGENSSPEIKIDASTSKGTKLTLAYSDLSEISEETFIRFKKVEKDTVIEENIFIEESSTSEELEIDLNLKVNPTSIVTFNIDESVLTGRGSGDLNFKFNSDLDFDLYGNYVVDKADYMFAFTTGLVETKKFNIEKGGKVTWNGDAMKGIMDIKAQYDSKLPSLVETASSGTKDVYSIINLKGELLKPEVEFAIEIPNSTDEEQVTLNTLTNSEEKLAKQFLSILIMNSFYIENDGITKNISNQLVSSTAGLLTSQLNKLLNETQNEFDMGIRINPGTGGELNSQEIQFYMSRNLMNDRLRLNGNVGTPIGFNTSRVKGNFELEYDVKKDGKLKLRVFNRTGESTTDQNVHNTQGLGLFYRLEYDNIFGFLKKKPSTN